MAVRHARRYVVEWEYHPPSFTVAPNVLRIFKTSVGTVGLSWPCVLVTVWPCVLVTIRAPMRIGWSLHPKLQEDSTAAT